MRKLLSAVLCAAILFISIPFVSSGEDYAAADAALRVAEKPAPGPAASQTDEPTPEDLEAIIKLVKPKFDIPEEYEDFSWNYYAGSYDSAPTWLLMWTAKDGLGSVTVNTGNDGRIERYSKYVSPSDSQRNRKLPLYLKSELEGKAREFLVKIVPEAAESLCLKNVICHGIYWGKYDYRYVRYENGIPFPANTATVSVDNFTGEVTDFYLSYDYDAEVPDADGVITREQAIARLDTMQNMTLSYRRKYETDENGLVNAIKAYLVYTPELSYLSVDAKTGELYTETSQAIIFSSDDAVRGNAPLEEFSKQMAADADAGSGYVLNEKELEQLDVLDKLITREQAIKAVTENSALYINPSLTTVKATLQKTGGYSARYYYGTDYECDYYWSIDFTNPQPGANRAYDYSYASALVNAENGRLISYYASLYNYYYYTENNLTAPEINYTQEQARTILEGFLKEQLPEKFGQSQFSETSPVSVLRYAETADGEKYPIYGSYSCQYNRVNEGVEFRYNSIHGSVDCVTGKINSYSYVWQNDIQFESPADALSEERAYDIFMSLDGFGLNYEINHKYIYKESAIDGADAARYGDLYDYRRETRLVYSNYETYPAILSALTGEQIDYNGDVYSKLIGQNNSGEGYSYTDVSGHWAERIIRLFGDVNVGFAGGSFKPDQKITAGEFTALMNAAGYYDYNNPAPIIPLAGGAQSEPAEGKEGTAAEITRTAAVRALIGALGFAEVAEMGNIFKTDFADNLDIIEGDMGYIAIARGFGMIQGSDGSFRPYDTLTRAEALTMLQNTLTRSEALSRSRGGLEPVW